MRVWRALKARGAGILRDGVHLLPACAESKNLLEEQAAQVTEAGARRRGAPWRTFKAGAGRLHRSVAGVQQRFMKRLLCSPHYQ
jgi:hypothetical protein